MIRKIYRREEAAVHVLFEVCICNKRILFNKLYMYLTHNYINYVSRHLAWNLSSLLMLPRQEQANKLLNSSAAKDGKTLRNNLKYLNACSFLIIALLGSGLFVFP